jgi:sporulation protein YlmC with PRC-barrel domain
MRADEFDVGYWLLDDQLIDRDGHRCGRVDDVEFDGGPGEPARITAIVSGPAPYAARMHPWLRPLGRRIFGDGEVIVPWSAVRDIDVIVELKESAADLGLGAGDEAAARVIGRIPGA